MRMNALSRLEFIKNIDLDETAEHNILFVVLIKPDFSVSHKI